ncbi:lipoyl(octanoyl) transferase [Sphingomonas sp. MM-1]|uniref:lipoyl(octanoyl) transferase LipB n=1 Tax=Sphingomonas sp. MM-1 TaxID=745310 RepID=UPI0002C0C682|nr:lipoyl(octanoyl) transferase LipB [Sphingomonas sp. MM-1]AGH48141.1 lipoyl(octanoyl) transferase [Sphingomonas sp. MM-1]
MNHATPAVEWPAAIEWNVSAGLTPYPVALAAMEARVAAIAAGDAGEQIWLVEHPPLYTAGTSADPAELLAGDQFPVFRAGRGGRYTYHGPGQRVGYAMINLAARGRDVRRFVHQLEGWLIDTLGDFGVAARRAEGRIGIWVDDPDGREAKIGAIGVRVTRWVTYHGFAVNIAPDLSHFGGIVPCGIAEFPVTSMAALGRAVPMAEFDAALAARLDPFLDSLCQPCRDA